HPGGAPTVHRMTTALAMYGHALVGGHHLRLVHRNGHRKPLDLDRYRSPVDEVDRDLVARCTGATLDVGCGPARFVSALMERGLPALGVDVAPGAVAVARSAGATVLQRSVFQHLPGEGRWQHVLLLDENVGIGGCPQTLLRRVGELLGPAGLAIVEADPADTVDDRGELRFEDQEGRLSLPFPWARLGADAIEAVAAGLGFATVERWRLGGRSFLSLAQSP
ncbi:MAG TPA: methyltransferase domain-containing protein, partial [Nakamurella sp.]